MLRTPRQVVPTADTGNEVEDTAASSALNPCAGQPAQNTAPAPTPHPWQAHLNNVAQFGNNLAPSGGGALPVAAVASQVARSILGRLSTMALQAEAVVEVLQEEVQEDFQVQ